MGAANARAVEAGAFEPGLGNVDAAFERGSWIVAVGTRAGCRSAKLPSQSNVPEPLGYPPSQKATGVNPWMNARWVPSVALAPGLRSRSDCFGGVGKEGALRRDARPISLAESF